jgi:hypothetical protein
MIKGSGKLILSATAFLFLLSSCATVTRGTKEALVIESQPSGAKVTITSNKDGSLRVCETPCSVVLPRKHSVRVKIEKEGYRTVETTVVSTVCGEGAAGLAGNVLVGGIIGAGVDVATGATKCFKPNPLKVTLEPTK